MNPLPLPDNTILVSMDVTFLYTYIPHDDGILACQEVLDQRRQKIPPTECLIEMLTLVLKHINFTFNGQHLIENTKHVTNDCETNVSRRKLTYRFCFIYGLPNTYG